MEQAIYFISVNEESSCCFPFPGIYCPELALTTGMCTAHKQFSNWITLAIRGKGQAVELPLQDFIWLTDSSASECDVTLFEGIHYHFKVYYERQSQ